MIKSILTKLKTVFQKPEQNEVAGVEISNDIIRHYRTTILCKENYLNNGQIDI